MIWSGTTSFCVARDRRLTEVDELLTLPIKTPVAIDAGVGV
jgi:hypothetical protein